MSWGCWNTFLNYVVFGSKLNAGRSISAVYTFRKKNGAGQFVCFFFVINNIIFDC